MTQNSHMFDRRIMFVTGKGGVGKTTLSAALAFAGADNGKNVILVEVDPSPSLRYILGRDVPVYKEVRVADTVTVLTIEPWKALEEYAALQLKVKAAARMVIGNRVIRYFMQAAPGWRELVTLGKIWDLHVQKKPGSGKPLWDLIVVDAPATGHGLSFLRAPSVFTNIIKLGPMAGQTEDVRQMLMDPKRTILHVVTLPEDMAINEAASIVDAVRNVLGMTTGVAFVNGVHPPPFDEDEERAFQGLVNDRQAMESLDDVFDGQSQALLSAVEEQKARAKHSRRHLELIRQRIDLPLVEIPYLYPGRVDIEGVKKIAEIIKQSIPGDS